MRIDLKIINKILNKKYTEGSCKEKIYYFCLLVDMGLLTYDKLNYFNYYFWWYEVGQDQKPNKNQFTPKIIDFTLTKKGDIFKRILDLDNGSNYTTVYSAAEQIAQPSGGDISEALLMLQPLLGQMEFNYEL